MRFPLANGRSVTMLACILLLGLTGCPPADPSEDDRPPEDVPDPMEDSGGAEARVDADTTTFHEEEAETRRDTLDRPLRREEGVVGVTGTAEAPVVVLRPNVGGSFGLTGELARELRRLSGARVRVEGRDAATPIGRGVEVLGYELLEVGGERPHVGTLEAVDGDLWRLLRKEAEPLLLTGLPEIGVAAGMKIWVVGEEVAPGRLAVGSHGVIDPDPS